jgi:hypothetical protein
MGGRQRTSLFIERKRELTKEKSQAAKSKEKSSGK